MDSIVPRIAYDPAQVHLFDQPYAPAVVRDNVFLLYNTNLILSMGADRRSAGGLVRDRRVPQRQGEGRGTEFLADADRVFAADRPRRGGRARLLRCRRTSRCCRWNCWASPCWPRRFFSRRWIAYLIVAGCAIDFSMGIFLHARVQHLDNTAEHTYFTGLSLRPRTVPHRSRRTGFAEHGGVAQLDGQTPGRPLPSTGWRTGEAFHRGDPAFEPGQGRICAPPSRSA